MTGFNRISQEIRKHYAQNYIKNLYNWPMLPPLPKLTPIERLDKWWAQRKLDDHNCCECAERDIWDQDY